MPITVACQCGKSIEVPDAFAGRTGKCKACGSRLDIPAFVPVGKADFPIVVTEEDSSEWSRPKPEPREYGPRPWYYVACRISAYMVMALGSVPFVYFLIAAVAGETSMYRSALDRIMLMISYLAIMIVATGFGAAMLMLTDLWREAMTRAK